jgi:flagellar hook-associated protein 3 FlgL
MRVSTSQIYTIANIGMRDAQVAVDKTNQQLSSGKRVLSPADDPVAATAILMLNQELARTTQFSKNIDTADNNLSLEDTTLQSVVTLITRLKELAVRAGNTATLTPSDYKAISAEVDSRLGELMNLQNTRNASGQYIFAGFQSETQPFVNNGGGNYSYQGDEGQLYIQASNSVSIAVSDSGKKIFMDIPSSHNTFTTLASSSNKATPPAIITVGDVYDQIAFDKLFPENMVVTFNANSAVAPASPNYTITERSTGKVLVDKQLYVSGQDIEVSGAKFSILGSPQGGVPAVPATLPFSFASAATFAPPEPITIIVGNVTETLYLDRNVNNATDLAAALSSTTDNIPGSGAASNASKLASLGLTVTAAGLVSATGLNITVKGGSANTNNVTGLTTTGVGTISADGVVAKGGDQFIIESTKNQDVLTTVSRFSVAMKGLDGTQQSKDALANIIAKTIANFDNVVTNLSSVQGEVGARQNMLESTKDLNLDLKLNNQEVLLKLEDLDFAEASTRLQMQTFVLSAAQQSFIRVSDLSLFKFM